MAGVTRVSSRRVFGYGIHPSAGDRSASECFFAVSHDFHYDLAFIDDFHVGFEGKGQDFVGVCPEGQGTLCYVRYHAYGEGTL